MPGSQLMPASGGRALGVSGAHGAGCGRARCGLREGALVQLELMVLGSAFAHGARCGAPAREVRGCDANAAISREVWGRKTATQRETPWRTGQFSTGLSGWFVTPVGVAAASRRSLHSTSSLNESCSGCEWPRSALRRARTARCQAQSASPAFDRGVPGADRRGKSGRSSS